MNVILGVVGSFLVFSAVAADWVVAVDPSVELGAIKPVNAVNCGPCDPASVQGKAYKAANIPYARTHDMNHSWSYGGPHAIDIAALFPDFDADETKAENYDFHLTDEALGWMMSAGTEPFFRLGPSIEPWSKKYHTHPPKDYAKWARICEHVIAHYTEGWANGKRWKITYWEIWNEPDIGAAMWTGSKEEFVKFFITVAKHLKARFPNLKIGGPAMAGTLSWKELFIPTCAREKVPLDFYSWHGYCTDARHPSREAKAVREWLDKNGYERTESIYNEWNYVKGWKNGEWRYSREVESGRLNQKGAAYAAAMMTECQNASIDMAMCYDVRTYGGMNVLFDSIAHRPMRGYYPFYAWGRMLRDYPTQVKCALSSEAQKRGELFAVAARAKSGAVALYLSRYTDDDNVHDDCTVRLDLPKGGRYRCHLTDDWHIFTEIPLDVKEDGSCELMLVPSSFAFVESEK